MGSRLSKVKSTSQAEAHGPDGQAKRERERQDELKRIMLAAAFADGPPSKKRNFEDHVPSHNHRSRPHSSKIPIAIPYTSRR